MISIISTDDDTGMGYSFFVQPYEVKPVEGKNTSAGFVCCFENFLIRISDPGEVQVLQADYIVSIFPEQLAHFSAKILIR